MQETAEKNDRNTNNITKEQKECTDKRGGKKKSDDSVRS